ncbi:MAG TPA: aminotransferase class V-fold PLP-dependent enzyme [Planctomycetota bacterium]|nr:aminotransferase class V-fold PLP-dependent enzyme [Planctomycetota bacterium]
MIASDRIYLDHNATTPIDSRVLERYVEVESAHPANPSSAHTSGRRARAVVEDARAQIARSIGVAADEVVFVSGGTEANNMVVLGLGDPALGVVASAAEHASVLEPARRRGLIELPVDAVGRTRFEMVPSDVHAAAVVCAVHGQSEVGSVLDLAAARRAADRLGAALHVDASQTLGRVDLSDAVRYADTLALSMHKAGGPKGIGVLVVRRSAATLRPLFGGGGQERGLRSGTTSVALAAAAALTVELAVQEREQRARAMSEARAAFLAELARGSCRFTCLTPLDGSLPNTAMIEFPCVRDGRTLLPAIDLAGVDASHGAACASGSPLPPLVLRAMGRDEAEARRCVRFSFAGVAMIDRAQEAARRVREAIEIVERA